MRFAVAALLAMTALQETSPDAKLFVLDRRELSGELAGFDAAGYLRFRERGAGKELRIAVEEVARICFRSVDPVDPDANVDRIRLLSGGVLTGQIESYADGTAVLKGIVGRVKVRREEIRVMTFGIQNLADPEELPDTSADLLIREEKEKAKAEHGSLESIGRDVVFRAEDGGEKRFDRAGVKRIVFFHKSRREALAPGWYAKVTLRNGDRFVAVPRAGDGDPVRFFSHILGEVAVERRSLASIAFRPRGGMVLGHFVVCERSRVRLLDTSGRELWVYEDDVGRAQGARMLDNGNVLIANTSRSQVLEVQPTGRKGGRIVWRRDNVSSPVDAVRLENGNTLVAEMGRSRVAEYPRQGGEPVWVYTVSSPTRVDRLQNGNTFISARRRVVEVDRSGKVVWSLKDAERRYMVKAQRLENGHTLVAYMYDECVIEYDAKAREVWRMEVSGSPAEVVRTEDDRIFILERNFQAITEVNRRKRMLRKIEGLQNPYAFSIY